MASQPQRLEAAESSREPFIEKSFRYRKAWWFTPQPIARWHQRVEHRHETWFELFYDLVMVACGIQLGHLLSDTESITLGTVAYTFAIFMAIQLTWMEFVLYTNLFHAEDVVHMIFYVCQTLCILMLAIHLKPASHEVFHLLEWPLAFVVFFAASRFLFALMYLQVTLYLKPHGEYYVGHFLANFQSGVVFLVTLTFLHNPLCVFVWGLSFILHLALCHRISCKRQRAPYPLHIGHIAGRTGIFLMIQLGESIIQIVIAEEPVSSGGWFYATVTGSFFLIFFLAVQYFNAKPHHAKHHALHRNDAAGAIWLILNSIVSFSALVVGAAFRLIFSDFHTLSMASTEWLFCGGVSSFLWACFMIRISHKGSLGHLCKRERRGQLVGYLLRFIVTGTIACLPLVPKDRPVILVGFVCALVIPLTALDVLISKSRHSGLAHQEEDVDYYGGEKIETVHSQDEKEQHKISPLELRIPNY